MHISQEMKLHSVEEDHETVKSLMMDTPNDVFREGIKMAHDLIMAATEEKTYSSSKKNKVK